MTPEERYGIDLSRAGKVACPRCRRNGHDNSGDNLTVYGEGKGAFCFACEFTILSNEERESRGLDDQEEEEDEVTTRDPITPEENATVKKFTGIKGHGYRGIRDDTSKMFGVRYEYDPETGLPNKMLTPTTKGSELVGYKVRIFPKDFSEPIGVVGKDCDMVGQFLFKSHRRTCLIVGGETKQLNAYQMLADNQKRRGKDEYEATAVVCSTVGESACHKQVQSNYAFFDQFEKIIVCMDSDAAGEAATQKVCEVLPKGKAWVMKMRYKDADDYVVNKAGEAVDKEHEFVADYWGAKPWTPAGVVSSTSMHDAIVARAKIKKTPLPKFMTKLQKMMAGGIPLGYIINVGAASGIGKSSYINELVYHWIFHSPFRVGVVSLEANSGEYGENLLSRHMGHKIALIEDDEEKILYLQSDEVKQKSDELWTNEKGQPRFFLLEDNGDLKSIQSKVEELILSCDCKVIVIDPLNDAMAGMTNDQAELFMGWQKSLVKSANPVTIINCVHVRKSGGGQQANSRGAELSEEDFHGSSAIFKSGAANILMMRDKYAEDPVVRNTTRISASKIRWTGNTGSAGEAFYDNATHTLWDKEEYDAVYGPKDF